MMVAPSTCSIQLVKAGCGTPYFDDTFPIELRGILTPQEFAQIVQRLNAIPVKYWPNMGCFVCSAIFCVCTCGVCMFYGISRFVKTTTELRAEVGRLNQELTPRGIQLIYKDTNGNGQYSSEAPTWIEFHISAEAHMRQAAQLQMGGVALPKGPQEYVPPMTMVAGPTVAPPMGMSQPLGFSVNVTMGSPQMTVQPHLAL